MKLLRRGKTAIRITVVVLLVSKPDFSDLLDDLVSIIVGSTVVRTRFAKHMRSLPPMRLQNVIIFLRIFLCHSKEYDVEANLGTRCL